LGTLEKKYSPGVLGFWGFGVLGFVINSGMPLFNPED